MKFSGLHYFLAGAFLGQVIANPMRVVVVTSQEVTSNLRFGHAVANNDNNVNVAQIVRPPMTLAELQGAGLEKQKGKFRPCGARLREKAASISNAFKQALGMPVIETAQKSDAPSGMIHILPFIGTPPTFIEEGAPMPDSPHHHHGKHHGKHHGGHRSHHFKDQSFLRRIHFALMALGPWEGRAVAFVLGCGIGVLLRMIWVMAIISYRMIKGNQEESNEYTHIICEHYADAEEILVAPPNYIVSDEKTPIVEGVAPMTLGEEAK